MSEPFVEHVNVTVTDPARSAKVLCDIFGWNIRWHGGAINGGESYHVGGETSYVALYSHGGTDQVESSYSTIRALNHIGVVVDDLDAVEARVKAHGFATVNHADYEPGRRFYFHDHDNLEIEVVSYA